MNESPEVGQDTGKERAVLRERIEWISDPLIKAQVLAEAFHEAYEVLAPQFGYETRKETRAFDPHTPNGRLMIATCSGILERMGFLK